ncbi:MAG: GxxExxY protein [Bacteroidetes bacterium]|nr:GxxExxY protein [Bacteroidota bacterium]
MYDYQELTGIIIGKAIEVHKTLGPGLLESAYQACLIYELEEAGLDVKSEMIMPVRYKNIELDHGYRLDILVNDKVVLELKTVDYLTSIHEAQILTYMQLGNYPVGLLINFRVSLLKDGIKRFVF